MTLAFLWLTGRLLGSAWASTLQKRLLSAGTSGGQIWLVTYGALMVPGLWVLIGSKWPSHIDFWANALLAAVFDVAGNLAMVSALRATDLSIFAPLNAFRPVLAWIAGWVFLQEVPTIRGLAGVAIITASAFWILKPTGDRTRTGDAYGRLRAVSWRVLGLGLSTIGAVFLKRATLAGSAESTLGVWVITGGLCLLISFGSIPEWRRSLRTPIAPSEQRLLALHAVVFFAMQWLTLKVFQHTLLTYSFAFFQIGMVLQVILGWWLFREPDVRRRLTACAIMSLGAVLILFGG